MRVAVSIRETLKVFTWARAQHRLRVMGAPVSFSGAAHLVASETGLDPARTRAALAGGFSSRDTQEKLAAWNGLKLAQRHGQPVLVADLDPDRADPSAGEEAA